MNFNKTPIAIVVIGLCSALPVAAQTSVTMQAESMTRSNYALDGALIKVAAYATPGTASQTFTGASGTYNIQVYVQPETDGQSTLEVYKGATQLRKYTYPLSSAATSFTINNVALSSGETIKLVGRANAGAVARVDKIVLTKVATSTPAPVPPVATIPPATITPVVSTPPATPAPTTASPVTIEAEGMSLSSYAVETGNRIKLTSSTTPGTASKTFSGASGTYNMRVYVVPESDGQSTLEVYKGATQLQKYTYPLSDTATSFTINNVALSSGETIKLVGRANAGAMARVDKIVLTPVATGTPAPTPVPAPAPVPAPVPAPAPSACANPPGGYEGFGRNTTGGAGKPVYRVTNLNDSGAGSLRDALSQGNRCVVFDVGGTISLSGNLIATGANVTIDGLTAPAPGITLQNRTLIMQGSSGAGNVVLRGIRQRGTPTGEDAIRVYNASNIVIDRVSVSGYGDGAIDVTESSRDVTIQWSILGDGLVGAFSNLIGYKASRITLHHNLYINGAYRHPYCGRNDGSTTYSAEVVCDVRNNLVWNYAGMGTAIMDYGTANIVNNYYYTTKPSSAGNTISIGYIGAAGAYVSGNHSQNGWNINANGNQAAAYAAVVPTTTDAITAAHQVKAQAGARGPNFALDATDQSFIGQISIQ